MFEIKGKEISKTPAIQGVPDGYLVTENRPFVQRESPLQSLVRLSGHTVRRKPPKTDEVLWDSELPGFGLRCSPTGRKTWVVRFRERMIKRQVTLGDARKVPVLQARTKARQRLAANALDGLPSRQATRLRPDLTLEDFAEEFVSLQSRHWKPRTHKRSLHAIKRQILPVLGCLPVKDIARSDIARWRDGLAAKPGLFNRALPVLSSMCKLAETLKLRRKGSNPCRNTSCYPTKPIERYLSGGEYRALAEALQCAEREMPHVVGVIRLLLFTGARVGEIASLRWEWIKGSRIALPDSKTGPRIVYLNRQAQAVLADFRCDCTTGEVFPGMARERGEMPVQKAWRELRLKAGLPDVRLHDLRHSFASVAIRDGISLTVIGRLLGHALPETTARYAHLADDAVSEAADRVCGSIAAKLGVAP